MKKTQIDIDFTCFDPLRLIECEKNYSLKFDMCDLENFLLNAKNHKRFVAEMFAPIKWNANLEKTGELKHVVCDWLNKPIPPAINELLWALVRKTPYLTWIFLVDNPSTRLPSDQGNGFGNVALGVQVKSRKHSIDLVDALRRTPAQLRFLEALPFDEDIGEFNFYGFDLLIENNPEKKSIQQKRWFRKFEDQFALHCKVAPLWADLNRAAMDPANGATQEAGVAGLELPITQSPPILLKAEAMANMRFELYEV